MALESAGIKVEGEAEAILGDPVPGSDQAGTMMMARQVANAGVNIRAVYVATNSRAVMVTDDNAKVMELMAACDRSAPERRTAVPKRCGRSSLLDGYSMPCTARP
jgi:hypothetical protein